MISSKISRVPPAGAARRPSRNRRGLHVRGRFDDDGGDLLGGRRRPRRPGRCRRIERVNSVERLRRRAAPSRRAPPWAPAGRRPCAGRRISVRNFRPGRAGAMTAWCPSHEAHVDGGRARSGSVGAGALAGFDREDRPRPCTVAVAVADVGDLGSLPRARNTVYRPRRQAGRREHTAGKRSPGLAGAVALIAQRLPQARSPAL